MLMLATVRIGAIHSVVFAGFGAKALARSDRGERVAAGVHRRRHLPQGQERAPEGDRRRSARGHSGTRPSSASSAERTVERVIVLQRTDGPAPDRARAAT